MAVGRIRASWAEQERDAVRAAAVAGEAARQGAARRQRAAAGGSLTAENERLAGYGAMLARGAEMAAPQRAPTVRQGSSFAGWGLRRATDMALTRARGGGPSAAEARMAVGSDRALASQMRAAATAGPGGLAQRAAAAGGGSVQGQLVGQAGEARLGEVQAAAGQAQAGLGAQLGLEQQLAMERARLQQQTILGNQAAALQSQGTYLGALQQMDDLRRRGELGVSAQELGSETFSQQLALQQAQLDAARRQEEQRRMLTRIGAVAEGVGGGIAYGVRDG